MAQLTVIFSQNPFAGDDPNTSISPITTTFTVDGVSLVATLIPDPIPHGEEASGSESSDHAPTTLWIGSTAASSSTRSQVASITGPNTDLPSATRFSTSTISAMNTLSPSLSSTSTSSTTALIPPSINSSQKPTPPVRAIVGGITGGICFLAITLALFLLYLRRQSRNRAYPFNQAAGEAQTSEARFKLAPASRITSNDNRLPIEGPQRRTKATLRQEYIQSQVQQVQQELHDLKNVADAETAISASAPRPGDSGEADIRRILEQMETMKAQIERLQAQVWSEWAQGLSDEPPPGYDTTSSGQGGTPRL